MKRHLYYLAILALSITSSAYAVPVLQVGAPAGLGDSGTYADYQSTLTNPTETDTAITSGFTIYVAGVYQNQNVLKLGGKYTPGGDDWSSFGYPTDFDGKGAVLLVAVPEGESGSLTVNSTHPFYTSLTLNSLFPNNHDPLKDNVSDFLFFDIGDFANNSNAVPDFATETGAADGEIKTLLISVSNYSWLHFDVLALETSERGGGNGTRVVTTLENNPGSHDVTWKPGTPPPPPPQPAPEPGVLWLLATGLLGLRFWTRRV